MRASGNCSKRWSKDRPERTNRSAPSQRWSEITRIARNCILNSNKLFEAAHLKTEEVVQKYVEAADARMRRIEENLDGLIREHSNGKSH